MEASNELDVLDAGCGTGLCGPLLAPYARRLVGVDLSERMLAQARAREVYDELVKGELTDYLRASAGMFDAIVSADTLVYFGPLEEVVEAAERALRPGGHVVFTVEEQPESGYSLSVNGRYRHARRVRRAHARDRRTARGDRSGRAAPRGRRSGSGAGRAGHQTARLTAVDR